MLQIIIDQDFNPHDLAIAISKILAITNGLVHSKNGNLWAGQQNELKPQFFT